jgi:undecaprenyl-diphosphatase
MIEKLESIDHSLVLAINAMHSTFLDSFMWFLSGSYILLLLIPFVFYFLFKEYRSNQLPWIFAAVVLTVILTDQLSVHAFKEVFQRYRPSHNLLLKSQLHLHEYPDGSFYGGGKFGFVSSHAANYFGILTIISSLIRKGWVKIILLTIALLVIYSRIYLGVHYVSDVLCGALLGFVLAQFVLQSLLLKKVDVS